MKYLLALFIVGYSTLGITQDINDTLLEQQRNQVYAEEKDYILGIIREEAQQAGLAHDDGRVITAEIFLDSQRTPRKEHPAPFSTREQEIQRLHFCSELDAVGDFNQLNDPIFVGALAHNHPLVLAEESRLSGSVDVLNHRVSYRVENHMIDQYPLVWVTVMGKTLCGAFFISDESGSYVIDTPDSPKAALAPTTPPIVIDAGLHARIKADLGEEARRFLVDLFAPSVSDTLRVDEVDRPLVEINDDWATSVVGGTLSWDEGVSFSESQRDAFCAVIDSTLADLNVVNGPEFVVNIVDQHETVLLEDERIAVPNRFNTYIESRPWREHYPLMWTTLQGFKHCYLSFYQGPLGPQ